MKKYQLLICLFIFIGLNISCKHQTSTRYNRVYKKEQINKFKRGDVVYLKPDSIKVVIKSICTCSNKSYNVYYFDNNKHKVNMIIDEDLIY